MNDLGVSTVFSNLSSSLTDTRIRLTSVNKSLRQERQLLKEVAYD